MMLMWKVENPFPGQGPEKKGLRGSCAIVCALRLVGLLLRSDRLGVGRPVIFGLFNLAASYRQETGC